MGPTTERILVVDDEEPIREIVCSMLTAQGKYTCLQASSGEEALALLESGEQFALMLSDLMMTGMDGLALLERAKERTPDMPVVMVTAVHDISVALSCHSQRRIRLSAETLRARTVTWPPCAALWRTGASR